MWHRNILDFSAHLSFLGLINVITKTTYHSQSYNSSYTIILVYSTLLQLCLFFSLLCFSLFTTDCSQPLTSFYFLWILSSFSVVVLSLLVVVLSLLDFLLPYYFTLISFSRLLTILTPKAAPTPNQKPGSPVPINNPILLSSSLFTSDCWVPRSSHCNRSTCSFLFSIIIMLI